MCIICYGNYETNIKELHCCDQLYEIPNNLTNLEILYCSCNNVSNIPKELTKLKLLFCEKTNIKKIPKELINLEVLWCNNQVNKLPKELTKLTRLRWNETKSTYIPNTLVNLEELDICKSSIIKIPNELINLKILKCKDSLVDDIPLQLINLMQLYHNDEHKFVRKNESLDFSILIRQKKIKHGFKKFMILFKKYIFFKKLWKIAEYYTQKKYSPGNILKYIDLDD